MIFRLWVHNHPRENQHCTNVVLPYLLPLLDTYHLFPHLDTTAPMFLPYTSSQLWPEDFWSRANGKSPFIYWWNLWQIMQNMSKSPISRSENLTFYSVYSMIHLAKSSLNFTYIFLDFGLLSNPKTILQLSFFRHHVHIKMVSTSE